VTFVSRDHFGDLDRHDDLLDLFDVIRLMRALAWQEPVGAGGRLDMNADGAIDQLDLAAAVSTLLQQRLGESPLAVHLESTAAQAVLRLPDQSTLVVPHNSRGGQTDIEVSGELAEALIVKHKSFAALAAARAPAPPSCARSWMTFASTTSTTGLSLIASIGTPRWLSTTFPARRSNSRGRRPTALCGCSSSSEPMTSRPRSSSGPRV